MSCGITFPCHKLELGNIAVIIRIKFKYNSGLTCSAQLWSGQILLVRGHCNSCLGKPLVHEGTTAIPMTVEGHPGKVRGEKGMAL